MSVFINSCLAQSLSELYTGSAVDPSRVRVNAQVASISDTGAADSTSHISCDSAILVHFPVLQQLQICSGSWVSVRHVGTGRAQPALVYANSQTQVRDCQVSDVASSFAAITPILAYNLCIGSRVPFRLRDSDTTKVTSPDAQHFLLELEPLANYTTVQGLGQPDLPVSREVVLVKHARPVNSPLANATESPTDPDGDSEAAVLALKQRLDSGIRVVSLGTTICVPLPPTPQLATSSSVNPNTAPPPTPSVAYFTVASMSPSEPPNQILHVGTTNVKLQGGTWRALSPVGCQSLLIHPNPPTHPSGDTAPKYLGEDWAAAAAPTPHLRGVGALQPAWGQVAATLQPLVDPGSSAVQVQCAVLLHGPAGSGRHTAAQAAARALGLGVLPVSCLELQGSSDADTVAALEACFERASAFAPCVLLLRDLEELAGGGGGDEGGRSQAGAQMADAVGALVRRYCSPEARCSVLDRGCMLEAFRQGNWQETPGLVLLVGCAPSKESLPAPLGRCFSHHIQVEAPSREQHQQLLSSMLQQCAPPPALEAAAAQMAGLVARDARGVAADAAVVSLTEQLSAQGLLRQLQWGDGGGDGGRGGGEAAKGGGEEVEVQVGKEHLGRALEVEVQVGKEHLGRALERVRTRTATEIGAPQVPNVKWEDIGGLEDVKRAVLDTIELPLKHRELFAAGLKKRSGVLLYGPPGSGKTLLAKAVASQCSASFLSVKGPELINMYVGESERQVREVFARARRARPCVMFFDELDSLAPARGASGDSGGVMDRVVAQLLAEIDGVQGGAGGELFIIGATNRPDLLDPALMRPGRLDVLLYVGIAEDPDSKLKVLQALTQKFRLARDVDLRRLAGECPVTLTGADLYALAADAWMVAMKRIIVRLEGVRFRGGVVSEVQQQEEVEVTMDDFRRALGALTPSLSQEELAKYLQLKAHYESRQ